MPVAMIRPCYLGQENNAPDDCSRDYWQARDVLRRKLSPHDRRHRSSTLKRRWSLADFAPPIKICAGRIGWLEAEILKWQVGRQMSAMSRKKKGGE
jgi:hypothetical protein